MLRNLQGFGIPALIAVLTIGLTACGGSDDVGGPEAEATAVEEAVTEPTAAPVVRLLADDLSLAPGECTTLSWEVSDALRVYIDGDGVDPIGEREICPTTTTTYSLRAIYDGDVETTREVSVEVLTPTEAPTAASPATAVPPATVARPITLPATAAPTAAPTQTPAPAMSVNFSPANGLFEIPKKDLCTSVSWQTSGVTDVQLERNAEGRRDVGASGTEEACFGDDEVKYTLWFKGPGGAEEKREIVLKRED